MLCTEISYLAYYITSRNFHMPSEKLSISENLSVFFILDVKRIHSSFLKKLNEYLNEISLEGGRIISPPKMLIKVQLRRETIPIVNRLLQTWYFCETLSSSKFPCSDSISLIVFLIVIQLLKSIWGQKRANSGKHTTDCLWFSLPLSSVNIIIPVLQKSKLRSREFKSLAQERTAN